MKKIENHCEVLENETTWCGTMLSCHSFTSSGYLFIQWKCEWNSCTSGAVTSHAWITRQSTSHSSGLFSDEFICFVWIQQTNLSSPPKPVKTGANTCKMRLGSKFTMEKWTCSILALHPKTGACLQCSSNSCCQIAWCKTCIHASQFFTNFSFVFLHSFDLHIYVFEA